VWERVHPEFIEGRQAQGDLSAGEEFILSLSKDDKLKEIKAKITTHAELVEAYVGIVTYPSTSSG